jgi:hypothetical protein
MPCKFNESRRHKIPKARYRVTNWPDYDAALVRRGSLTVWLTEEAVMASHMPAAGERGGQPIYSDIAIETGLALRLVLHQPLRQTEGALRSIAALLGVPIRSPGHTTFSRRVGGLKVMPQRAERAIAFTDRRHGHEDLRRGRMAQSETRGPHPLTQAASRG